MSAFVTCTEPPFGADQLFALGSSAGTQIDHYVCRGSP